MATEEHLKIDTETPKDMPDYGWLSTGAFVLVCAVPIFANLAFGGVSSGAFAFVMLLTVVLPILWFSRSLLRREVRIPLEPAQLAILGLILLGLFQLLPFGSQGFPAGVVSEAASGSLTLDPNGTRMAVIKLFVFAVYFAAALTFIDSHGRIRKVAVTLIVFGSLMAFFGVLQFLGDPSVIYGLTPAAQARPFGSYVNQHHFASFLVMIFGLTVGILAGRAVKRDKIVFLLFAAVLLGTGVIFTGSRGAFLSLVAVIAFHAVAFLLLRKRGSKNEGTEKTPFLKSTFVVGGAAAGLLLLLILVAVWAGGEQGLIRGAGMQASGADFSTGRIHFWTVALKIFQANPLIGSGLESFGVAFTRYDTMNGMYRIEQAHNDYLQMLADGGIVGFLIAVSFIFFLFRGGVRVIRETHDRFRRSVAVGALSGCFGVLVHSFVDFPLRTNANAFFFLLLAALALVSVRSGRTGHR